MDELDEETLLSMFGQPGDSQEALIAALRQRQAEQGRLGGQLHQQQAQAGQLRSLAMLSSLGSNPLLDGVNRSASQQAESLDGLSGRTEARLGVSGVNPLRALALRQAAEREKRLANNADALGQHRKDTLDFQKQKAGAGAGAAAAKAETKQAEDLRRTESQLRREVLQSDSGKQYLEARTAYQGIQSFVKNPSPATDMALVFGAMKALDPTSVVKEGEQVQVRNTTNLPGQVLNYFEKVKSGQSFTQAQREELRHMAELGLRARAKTLKDLSDAYAPIAQSAGADMRNIMPLNLDLEETSPGPAVAPPKPPAPVGNPRDFARTFEGQDGRKFGQLKNGSVVLIKPDGTLEPVTVKGK